MPIVPTGYPAWTRLVSFAHYGGHESKENYLSRGAINPLTDVAAEEFSRMVSDLAAAVRGAPFATITYLNNDSSPAAPTIESVFMMTGVRLVSYAGDAAPSGFPSAARNGQGDVTFTFDASYLDEYGISGAFAPAAAAGTGHGSAYVVATSTISGQTVRVRALEGFATPVSDARITLVVT
jgi:hypothetical protein